MLITLYRIAHLLAKYHIPFFPKLIKIIIFLLFHCVIPPSCIIGQGTKLWHHGLGIIIHPNVTIGKNCHIYNHVVFGGGHDGPHGPPVDIVIGDNVTIGAGAKILCKETKLLIGKGSTIAANAVVLGNVPPYSVVAGVPAIIVKTKST